MARQTKTAELRAGLIVLAGLVVLAGGLFLVSGGSDQFTAKKRLRVFFQNAGGLKAGDVVSLAGRQVGEVVLVEEHDLDWSDVASMDANGDGLLTKEEFTGPESVFARLSRDEDEATLSADDLENRIVVAVTIEVRAQDRIQVDSVFTVSKTITGIVTLSVDYGLTRELAEPETTLFGRRLSSFEEAIHSTYLLIDDARGVVRTAHRAVERVDKIIAELDVAALRATLGEAMEEFRDAGVEFAQIAEDAHVSINAALQDARDGMAEFEALVKDIHTTWGKIDPDVQATLKGTREAAEGLDEIVDNAKEPVKAFLQELNDGASRIAPALLKIEELAQGLDETVIELRPKLRAGLSSARTAFANFEAVTEDLKTAPWKLINEPSGEETREVHLYNAARLYVTTTSRIQELVDDLETLRELGALADERHADLVRELLDRLDRSLKEYDERERALTALIVGEAGGSK
jgi:ABC-type transporter Mla subunit MlaD